MTRQDIYKMLVKDGHSPQKALEIAIDFERGNATARAWVVLAAQAQKGRGDKCG